MAALLIQARDAAEAPRLAGHSVLDATLLEDLITRYRALAGSRQPVPAHRDREGRPSPHPALPHLRGPDPAVRHPPRPGHLLQQRSRADDPARQDPAAQLWRMLADTDRTRGVRLCPVLLSTAAKWGISKLHALFKDNTWLAPSIEPTG